MLKKRLLVSNNPTRIFYPTQLLVSNKGGEIMTIEKRVANAVADSGITVVALSRRTGISYGRLSPSLKGRRELRASEYLAICKVLQLDPKAVAQEETT